MPIATLTERAASDPTAAYRYRDGLYAADLITAALVHLDIFSWLAERPSTQPEICAALGLTDRPVDVLVTLCVANGFLARAGEQVVVTDLAREHLVAGSPFHLGPYYASLKDRPVVTDFLRVLRSDKPAHWGAEKDGYDWHRAMEEESFAKAFTAAMDCRGLFLAQAMLDHVDLSGRKRVLDIGGGSGIYACAIAARHPALQAVVFDQAPVDRIAKKLIDERGCAAQVTVETGSFFSDPWPAGCDVHLFSNVLHDWGLPEVRALINASCSALPPGGLVVIHEAFINAAKTGPRAVAEYSALLMHSTQGKCYATSEYEPLLKGAGFTHITFAETAADRGVMTAVKPGAA
jgi:predicted O-methyltransferase YrrM